MEKEQFKKELGLQIRTFRNSRKYTQEQFCEIIDLDQSNLSNIENGKNFPDITTLFNIIKKTGIEPNFLFGFSDEYKDVFTSLDYEIINMLLKLPEESKVRIKNIIEIVK